MPSRTTQQRTSSRRLLLISSPFLLVRFVIFSLLVYMSLTALVFAAWNVGASRAARVPVDGSSAFLLFNGIAISLCIAMALANLKISSFSTSQVGFECAWTGIFTLLQIAASIFVTLSGPPEFCRARAPLSVCASTTILVPISWLAATLLLGYFIAILALCVAHLRVHWVLWSASIYEIAWFDDVDSRPPRLPPLATSPLHISITPPLSPPQAQAQPQPQPQPQSQSGGNVVDVENQLAAAADPDPDPNREKPLPSSPSSNTWWGRLLPGRAGRDHPFTIRRPGERPADHYYPGASSSLPAGRRNTVGDGNENSSDTGPRVPAATFPYSRSQREQQQETLGLSIRFGVTPDFDPGPSTDVVVNEDEPIPLGDRSEWVRAPQTPGPYAPPPPPPPRNGRRR